MQRLGAAVLGRRPPVTSRFSVIRADISKPAHRARAWAVMVGTVAAKVAASAEQEARATNGVLVARRRAIVPIQAAVSGRSAGARPRDGQGPMPCMARARRAVDPPACREAGLGRRPVPAPWWRQRWCRQVATAAHPTRTISREVMPGPHLRAGGRRPLSGYGPMVASPLLLCEGISQTPLRIPASGGRSGRWPMLGPIGAGEPVLLGSARSSEGHSVTGQTLRASALGSQSSGQAARGEGRPWGNGVRGTASQLSYRDQSRCSVNGW